MTRCSGIALAMLAGVLAPGPASAQAHGAPQRIVTLNACADQIVVDLVPRERIRAVSHLAADPLTSAVAEKARGIPWTRGNAEEVLAFDPDLVIAGEYTTPATVALLERLGLKILKVPDASDFNGARAVTRLIADAVGEREKAERLLADFDRRIAAAAPADPSWRPKAVVYQVNNLASGPGSIADTVLRAAGFTNLTAELNLGSGGQLPLEALVADPPDLIVLSGPTDEYRTVVADNLRHPALAALMRMRRTTTLPWRLWLCATLHLAEAVEHLAAVRATMTPRAEAR
ncbi:MAG: ABC transporter substrate-binding protein [Hyphomicrobiaceae bacterium]